MGQLLGYSVPRLFVIWSLAPGLTSCSKTADPISDVVDEESHNQFFGNGMWAPIHCPPSATATQVISSILDTNFTILEVRSVRICFNEEIAKEIDPKYSAVLVKGLAGKRVYLLQYQSHSGGWRSWDYEVK